MGWAGGAASGWLPGGAPGTRITPVPGEGTQQGRGEEQYPSFIDLKIQNEATDVHRITTNKSCEMTVRENLVSSLTGCFPSDCDSGRGKEEDGKRRGDKKGLAETPPSAMLCPGLTF